MSMNSWFATVYLSQRCVMRESVVGVGLPVCAKFTHILTMRRRTTAAALFGKMGAGQRDIENKWKMS